MNLNSAVIIGSALIFVICASAFIIRSVRSYNFRNKVALPHGFSEGIMTGASYPALITAMSLLFIQLATLIAFKSPSETVLALRAGCYLLTALVFFVLFKKTPTLLAYWFGQNGLWEHSGRKGKIAYSDIYNARLSKKLRLPIINNQQLCKFTFYVKNKNIFFHPKKYFCKMTACEISALSRQVEFTETPVKTESTRVRVARRLVPAVLFVICIVSIVQFCVSGVFNEAKYSAIDGTSENEIITFSAPSQTYINDGKLFVYFDNLKAANVYTPSGEFLHSVSMENSPVDTINQYEGKEYKSNSLGVWYAGENGEKTFVINYPIVNTILNTDLLWLVNAFLIFTAIMLRWLADEYKRPSVIAKAQSDSEAEIDDFAETEHDISALHDETAAS